MNKFRDYQHAIINTAIEKFSIYNKILIKLPCGGGKTIIASAICNQFDNVLFLAHREELLNQANASFNKEIDTCSVFSQPSTKYYDIVVIDEAHHETMKSYTNYFANLNYNKVLGLTATPERLDNRIIAFDYVINGPTIEELVKQSFLSEQDLYILHINDDIIIATIDWINNTNIDLGQTIIFTKNLNDAFKVKKNLHNAEVITSNSNRNELISNFKSNKFQYLISCQLLTEGINIPCTKSVVLLRNTKSRNLLNQMIGRSSRLHESKTYSNIIECYNIWEKVSKISVQEIINPRSIYNIYQEDDAWRMKKSCI